MQLAVPYHKQQTEYTCGIACIRMVCDYYKIDASRSELLEILEPNEETGTPRKRLRKGIEEQGLFYTAEAMQWPSLVDALEQQRPVIVNYLSLDDGDGHYGVAIGYTDTSVILHDPWIQEAMEIPIEKFTSIWYGHNTEAADHGWGLIAWR